MRLIQELWVKDGVVRYSGEVTPLPGCPDVAVSHAVYCHRGSGAGAGKRANRVRQTQLADAGYSAAVCTVDAMNLAQREIMRSEGWALGGIFRNRRTGNDVCLYMKEL